MLSLFFVLYIGACTAVVYNITPFQNYKPNYYFNTIKHFASNTQLHFQKGTHILYKNFNIENVANISLVGEVSLSGLLMESTIYCVNPSVNVIIRNIINLTIQNIKFMNCETTNYGFLDLDSHIPIASTFILIQDCYNVYLENVTLEYKISYIPLSGSLIIINVLGRSVLSKIRSSEIWLIYTDHSSSTLTDTDNEITVSNYTVKYYDYEIEDIESYLRDNYIKKSIKLKAFYLVLKQNFFTITVKLIDTTFIALNYNKIVSVISYSNNNNFVLIENCLFQHNFWHLYTQSVIEIKQSLCKSNLAGNNIINIKYCSFMNNRRQAGGIVALEWILEDCLPYEQNKTISRSEYIIKDCVFKNNSALTMIGLRSPAQTHIVLHIIKTQFTNYGYKSMQPVAAIIAENVKLFFSKSVIFHDMVLKYGLLQTNDEVYISNDVAFSSITASSLIDGSINHRINFLDEAYINITNVNIMQNMFTLKNRIVLFYPLCYFQYQRTLNSNWTESQIVSVSSKSIEKISDKIFDINTGNINCKFQQGTIYQGLNPLNVYMQHLMMEHKETIFDTGFLCYCQNMQSNCSINTLKSAYPGQKLIIKVSLNPKLITDHEVLSVSAKNSVPYESVCRLHSFLEAEQLIAKRCTEIKYTILSNGNAYCKLFLYSNSNDYYLTVYYVKLLACPMGFELIAESDNLSKKCDCDTTLINNQITQTCNINDQTILRPANSWISATTHNNSYTYHISLNCPFHYCLPHKSHLSFSTPNSQCQFNRSGLLCGNCQQGLSTVFSSSHCKTCSNIHLLLIIPIIVFGFLLVVLLFILNLTVTDGTVNGFILYVNIISINTPILFPDVNHFTPAYTFISLANLDLGIQTCFYNGMDDYTKIWLQLAFPFYLIFIATLIIITSRYSTTIQRLTARRALPVLATLFLLSYTKILRIVSSVLFFYSTITQLPSKYTTLVWSVDANVPLFGVRFTILFIVCLILFLILVPFNVILLFTRTLSRFNVINKFKPLLDAYQGPYKFKFYYWTGLQLLIRAVIFGTSSLDRNLNLTINIALFSILEVTQGTVKPFKSQFKNFQEHSLLMNIIVLYAFLLYDHKAISTIVVNIMISITAIYLMLIIAHHIIIYACSQVISNKIKSGSDAMIKWMYKWQGKSQAADQFELNHNLCCNVPEAVNYHEFRESLLN